MHRVVVAIALVGVVSACGKKEKADCERYARRVIQLGSPDLSESRVKSVMEGARESCERGDMTVTEINCVIAASNHSESLKCHGLDDTASGSAVANGSAGSSAPPSDRVRRAAFSMKIPLGWAEDPDPRSRYETAISISSGPKQSAMVTYYDKDSARELGALANEAACKAYGAKLGMAIDAATFSDTPHGKACELTYHDQIGGDTVHFSQMAFAWGDGGEIYASCSFSGATEPEPGCAAIRDSIGK